MLDEVAVARGLLEEATVHLRAAGDRFNLALATGNLGDLASMDGDHVRAEALFEEALALYRELGREHGVQYSLYNLAALRLRTGRPLEAASAASESLAISHRLGDARFAVLNLSMLGSVAAKLGDPQAGARLVGAAEAERARIGLSITGTAEGELHEGTIEDLRVALGSEALDSILAEAESLALDEAVAIAVEHGGKTRQLA
jgi:tetratricopeptide (TPR) repeat protein